ncbi:MAG: hypothetical protein AAFO97_15095 [Pseudomonadota bacterium]
MADPAPQHTPPTTALSILQETERLAHKVQRTTLTELECDLLLHHMPQLLTEYRQLRQSGAASTNLPPVEAAQEQGQTNHDHMAATGAPTATPMPSARREAPRLQVVRGERGQQ